MRARRGEGEAIHLIAGMQDGTGFARVTQVAHRINEHLCELSAQTVG